MTTNQIVQFITNHGRSLLTVKLSVLSEGKTTKRLIRELEVILNYNKPQLQAATLNAYERFDNRDESRLKTYIQKTKIIFEYIKKRLALQPVGSTRRKGTPPSPQGDFIQATALCLIPMNEKEYQDRRK